MLTAFTVATASIPRIAYRWLNKQLWFPDGEGFGVFATVVGAHAPLFALVATNQSLAAQHHLAYAGMAAVGLIGAALWILHEALRAKKEYDDIPKQEPDSGAHSPGE